MNSNVSIVQISNRDIQMKDRLDVMRSEIHDMAVRNVENVIKDLTGPEAWAAIEFEKLNLISGYDLLTNIIRYETMKTIESHELYTYLGYGTATEAFEVEGGLSPSEQSNIKDLNEHILPYVRDKLGISLVEFWHTKKSNLREITPHLKSLITGERSKKQTVIDAIERVQSEIVQLNPGVDNLTIATIQAFIDLAQSEKQRGLREALRPPASPIDAVIIRRNGISYLVAELDEDASDRVSSSTTLFNVVWTSENPKTIALVRKLIGE